VRSERGGNGRRNACVVMAVMVILGEVGKVRARCVKLEHAGMGCMLLIFNTVVSTDSGKFH